MTAHAPDKSVQAANEAVHPGYPTISLSFPFPLEPVISELTFSVGRDHSNRTSSLKAEKPRPPAALE